MGVVVPSLSPQPLTSDPCPGSPVGRGLEEARHDITLGLGERRQKQVAALLPGRRRGQERRLCQRRQDPQQDSHTTGRHHHNREGQRGGLRGANPGKGRSLFVQGRGRTREDWQLPSPILLLLLLDLLAPASW